MCGIAGIVLPSPQPSLPQRLAAMADAMTHRGPDDGGVFVAPDGRMGLANRRLAIRDLSPAGHMPMGDTEKALWITYNGEIYNVGEIRPELERLGYHFRSESDTEVVLYGYAAWGAGIIERLRGMFALAIFDGRPGRGELFLARDRLGIKPIYYTVSPEGFAFASELKALEPSGMMSRAISSAGLVGYLRFGSVPNPLTIYRDVQALEPGHTLALRCDQPGTLTKRRYWSLPTNEGPAVSQSDAVAQVRALLEEAVRIRLVSDVPLGAFLSGGLDSSAVVALMRRATNGPLRTCSMVFEEAEFSEAPFARAMAEHVGAEHFERVITAQDVQAELPHILAAMDQPTIDGVNTYFVSQTARQAGLTVALSGLGGDELFGGYPNTFGQVPRMLRALSLAHAVPGGRALARTTLRALPDAQRWSRVHDALGEPASLASAYLTRRGLFSAREVQALVTPQVWEDASKTFNLTDHIATRAEARGSKTANREFEWVSRAELATYTHHQLLRDTDVMSMTHSLEVRVPLLDHRLVEAVLRLPTGTKLNSGSPKPLLAAAVADLLPPQVRDRRDKQGFTFPFARWLQGPLATWAAPSRGTSSLNPKTHRSIWEGFLEGKVHWSRVWALAVLSEWVGTPPL